jgi:hypothetical protein
MSIVQRRRMIINGLANAINNIITAFKTRVLADSGIFESESFLYNILNTLKQYYNSFSVFITANAYKQNFLFAIKPTPITENYYLQTTASVFTSCCTTTKTFDVTASTFTIAAEIEPYQGNEGVLEICGGSASANWTFIYNSSGQFQLTLPGITPVIVSTVTKTPIRIRQWVRVSKIASLTYRFYFSIDGINWTQVGENAVRLDNGGAIPNDATANSTNLNVGRGSGGNGCFIGKIYNCNFYTTADTTSLFASFKANEAQIGRYSKWASLTTGELWVINQGSGNPQISNQGIALYTGGGSRFRTNSAGLIEDTKRNLIQFSEDFSQSIWQKSNVTTVSNNAIAPDGTMTASTITFANVNAQILQSFTTIIGVSYTYTTWVKGIAGQRTNINILKPSSPFENTSLNLLFDGSWQMVSLTFTALSTTTEVQIRNNFPVGNLTATNFSWWRVMVEVGSAYTAYQYTTTDAIYPRLDYRLGAPAILSEPAATNLIQNSMLLNSGGIPSGWSNNISTGTGGSASIVASGLSGIFDSKSTINKYTFNVSGTVGTINALINRSVTVVSGTAYVISVRVESYSGNIRYNDIIYTIAQNSFAYFINGVSVNPNALINQTGLLECRVITNAETANIIYGLGMYGSINGNTGGTASIVLSAPQFELGTIATSFISTIVGATSTRVADSFNYINNSIINQTQGTLYFEFYYSGQSIGAFRPILGISDSLGITAFDYIAVFSNSVGTGLQVFLRSGNTNRVTASYTTFNTGWNKIAVVFSPTSVTPYFNGVNLGSTTPNNSPNSFAVTLDRIQIGNSFPILVKNIAYMPSATALTNSQLLALTT